MACASISPLFDDYVRFHRLALETGDVDPVYPVLRRIAAAMDWNLEERIRLVFTHVAYYDIGSALTAYGASGWRFRPVEGLKFGTERRRNRMPGNMQEHLASLRAHAAMNDGLTRWLSAWIGDDPVRNWQDVTRNCLMQVQGNGRWAAFKTAEMLAEVAGLPLRAPDMGHANSSGPRQGLALLFEEARVPGNSAAALIRLNVLSERLVRMLRDAGCDAELETAETTLCDFHSMVKGRYYVGHDIDQMREQLDRAPMSNEMLARAYSARYRALPHAYLGELGGWRGVDVQRNGVYKRTGKIITRE